MSSFVRAIVIILHDLVVVSPSYFIFEMEKVRVLIQANSIDEFKIANGLLKRWSLITFAVFCVLISAGAFMTSYGL
jgi:hypothetical protein